MNLEFSASSSSSTSSSLSSSSSSPALGLSVVIPPINSDYVSLSSANEIRYSADNAATPIVRTRSALQSYLAHNLSSHSNISSSLAGKRKWVDCLQIENSVSNRRVRELYSNAMGAEGNISLFDDSDSGRDKIIDALACGLLRLGEFATKGQSNDRVLCWRHIEWRAADGKRHPLINGRVSEAATEYRVLLEASKSDPFRQGVTIRVCAPMAFSAMKHFCNLLSRPPIFNSPVFDLSTATNQPGSAPLTRDIVVKSIRNYLDLIGESHLQYNGHSFRKGGAQSLAEASVHRDIIQVMGRWSSDCYKLYINTPEENITSASLALEP